MICNPSWLGELIWALQQCTPCQRVRAPPFLASTANAAVAGVLRCQALVRSDNCTMLQETERSLWPTEERW